MRTFDFLGRRFCRRAIAAAVCGASVLGYHSSASAEIIADSRDDWSTSGTQGENDWFYGYRNFTTDGGDPNDWTADYDPENMILFEPGHWTGNAWDLGPQGPWTFIGQENTHPNGTNSAPNEEHWSTRRWVADSLTEPTAVALNWNIRATNLGGGGGTTGGIFINGVYQDSATVGGTDGTGSTKTWYAWVSPGDQVDLVLTPQNVDGSRGDGADGSAFWLSIDDDVPVDAGNWIETITDQGVTASSQFSGVQGQDGWFYGYYDVREDVENGDGVYATDEFIPFLRDGSNTVTTDGAPGAWENAPNQWDGSKWDMLNNSGNPGPWTEITAGGGHPAGNGQTSTEVQWAMRRWVSEQEGELTFDGTISNGSGSGDGTVGRIFVDGVEVVTEMTDGSSTDYSFTTNIVPGTIIDFAIDPDGADVLDEATGVGIDDVADGSDSTNFSITTGQTVLREFIPLGPPPAAQGLVGGGQTYEQNFDEMGVETRLPRGWSGVTEEGATRRAVGLGLTDGFLTVPGNPDEDGVLGVVNVGGNEGSFGPAPDGFVPTWTAELAGASNLFGQEDAVADNATDRALGVSRENNDHEGELNFEISIIDSNLRAFVLDWDLEIWGGDPDGDFRSADGPGMKVDVSVGGNSYDTMTANLLPGDLFDTLEDGSGSDHNATLINGNVHAVRGMTSGIKEVRSADGAVGNTVQIKFNSNWNGATDNDANGWISAIDNVRLRALAPGDADANGIVDVADLLQLLGGQKFNQGVDAVTWEQGDFNADDQFNTGDLLAMLSFLSGTFPSDPYASEAGGASDAVADIIVNSETGEVTVDLAGHTVSAIIIESASEIFNGQQPEWDTTSQFPSTLPGELGNVLFTSTAAGVDELGAVISAEFLGRDKEFYLQDLDLNILIASEGGALTKGNVIVVPEPSTWMLLGLGSLAIVGVIRRQR